MSSYELCGHCRGEGYATNDRDGWGVCWECGGGGYVDEYQEDEWYDDGDDCGMADDGSCPYEGSEHCEFFCPVRRAIKWEDDEAGYAEFADRRPFRIRVKQSISRLTGTIRRWVEINVLRRQPADYIPF